MINFHNLNKMSCNEYMPYALPEKKIKIAASFFIKTAGDDVHVSGDLVNALGTPITQL